MTPLENLATWVSGVRPDDVPDAQHDLVRGRLLDTLGLIAAASTEPVCRSVLAWAEGYAETGAATVIIGGGRYPPAVAALVHGTLAHARDFDDTFPESVVHPGSMVVSAVLSVAEATDADFPALSTAIVLGYEVAARLGKVAGRGFHARGFHATGVVGPLAAAAAAGHLLRLDADAMADALGLATSMSGGLLAFLADGGWSKWLHTGWAAHGGITAAELARGGFRGPRHALHHPAGLYGAFLGADTPDLTGLTEKLGATWLGGEARPKYYPCAHVIQPYIDAVLALRREGEADPAHVASIRCTLAPWALPIVATPRAAKIAPRNDLEAIASLPFILAAALADSKVDLDTLRTETLMREDICRLAARIDCEADAALGSGFDGRLVLQRTDGAVVRREAKLADGGFERIRQKFHANAARLFAPAVAQALDEALCQGQPGGREILRLALGKA
jgi:2-methylcitrate dehydratase PrpD